YTFNGDSAGDYFGWSVSGAGDVNGDGFADLVVGAWGDDNRGSFSGSARVLSGKDGKILYAFNGDSTYDYFGYSVSGAGDVNGDSFADVIVGALLDDNNGTNSGSARVLSGTTQPPRMGCLFTFDGDSVRDYFGGSVSGAGDVNRDGHADVIVGARGDDNNGIDSGSARVLSGQDGRILYTFHGDSAGDSFGGSVSGAGDVNRDGYADLIVGAYGDDNNGSDSGSARVLSGQDGRILYTFHGDSAGDLFGLSVSAAGDVNRDGYADVIIGARADDNNGLDSGSARVFSGRDGRILYTFNGDSAGDHFGRSVSGAGDVNRDGHADVIVGAYYDDNNGTDSGSARVFSGKDGRILYTFNGDSAGDWFGFSVSGAGDVNGDGHADLIVGAYGDDNKGPSSGSARVLSGKDGRILHTFDGDSANDVFGWSVSGAGDVNGDGFADLVVGARGDDNSGSNSGSARVLSGKDGTILRTLDGDSAEDQLGDSVSGAGDVNGDGFADLIVGAPLDDNNGLDSGSARVCSGRPLTLWSDKHQLSLKQAGSQVLFLSAGTQHAGRFYWMLGSASGVKPGVTLAGTHFPLNPDLYTDMTLALWNTNPPFLRFKGQLDLQGRATAAFNVPANLPPVVDFSLFHAYLVYDAQGFWHMVSNAVSLRLRN
ncbi:MAG: hypothetical protein ACYS5W_09690, partial [Planctomycetota bacterium]